MNAHVFLQMQILVSLLPFQNLRGYSNFQKSDIKKASFFKVPRLVAGARRVPLH